MPARTDVYGFMCCKRHSICYDAGIVPLFLDLLSAKLRSDIPHGFRGLRLSSLQKPFDGFWRAAHWMCVPVIHHKSVDAGAIRMQNDSVVPLPILLTVEQVAKILNLTPYSVRRNARKGSLQGIGKRIGKRWYFSQKAIDDFLNTQDREA